MEPIRVRINNAVERKIVYLITIGREPSYKYTPDQKYLSLHEDGNIGWGDSNDIQSISFHEYIKEKGIHLIVATPTVKAFNFVNENSVCGLNTDYYNRYKDVTYIDITACSFGPLFNIGDKHKRISIEEYKILFNLTNNKNEVLKKNTRQDTTRRKGIRFLRQEVKIASGSRPNGSRATSLRSRARIRNSETQGKRLLFNENIGEDYVSW